MTSSNEHTREEGAQAESPFIVLHEVEPSGPEPHDGQDNLDHGSAPISAAPPSPSAASHVSSLHGNATSESTPMASSPASIAAAQARREMMEKGGMATEKRLSKMAKMQRKNTPRQQVPDDQRKPDVWSYLANSPAGAQSPVQGPLHTRQSSYPDQPYPAGPSGLPPGNQYQSPRQFSNGQRPEDDWASNSWNPQYAASNLSPSAMTFDGHFPPGPQAQPPFANGFMPPEMARGPSSTASFSPPFLQTNFPGANGMHGAPYGMVPLSGYELLAAKLSGSLGGPSIKPLYRRFEALNHRLLLHLQDELAELEEQLHGLDTADTQARQHPGGIFPASRRQESPNPNAPFVQRTELLGRIGYKICQYHQVLTSFREIQELPSPTMPDIQEYRTYLAAGHPVVEEEGRFLDATDDLARLDLAPNSSEKAVPETVYTPMPRSSAEAGFPPNRERSKPLEDKATSSQAATESQQTALMHLVLSVFIAVLAPIFCFLVIPSFVGRMTVVLLVGGGVATAAMQSGVLNSLTGGAGVTECIIATTVYAVAMSIIAGASS